MKKEKLTINNYKRRAYDSGGPIDPPKRAQYTSLNRPSDADNIAMEVLKILDPTGVLSWKDAYDTWNDPEASALEKGVEIFGALPLIGKFGKVLKGGKVAAKYMRPLESSIRYFTRATKEADALAKTGRKITKLEKEVGVLTDAEKATPEGVRMMNDLGELKLTAAELGRGIKGDAANNVLSKVIVPNSSRFKKVMMKPVISSKASEVLKATALNDNKLKLGARAFNVASSGQKLARGSNFIGSKIREANTYSYDLPNTVQSAEYYKKRIEENNKRNR